MQQIGRLSFWYRKRKWIATGIGLFSLVLLMIFTLFFKQKSFGDSQLGSYGEGEVPPAVLQWKPQIEKELAKYGRENQLSLLLAIISRESGGTGTLDVMQSSESIGLPPNSIQDPLYSIEVGVRYFDEVMIQSERVGVDIDTGIQAYNMGNGYISFVAQNGSVHSVDLAQQYSAQMKAKTGWLVYGDPNYVANVKHFMGEKKGDVGKETAFGDLQDPYYGQEDKYIVSSELGWRWGRMHNGIDLAPLGASNIPIASSGEGVVVFSGFSVTGGFMVKIRHDEYLSDKGRTLYTMYLHMVQPPNVNTGERVDKGQIIGLTGTTGHSTGVHLHFEVHDGENNPINPRTLLNFGSH